MERLKIVVVGAGMGGLTAALAMRQAGYEVEVYDRVRELRPAGAGVSLWSNGIKVLNRLGLGSQVAAIGGQMNRMAYVDKGGRTLTEFSLDPLIARVGQRPYPVTRTDLQQMLLQACGSDSVHLGCECVAVEQDATGATAVFSDGRRATGDLVIGADGTHSVIRESVLSEKRERRYVGYVNWNGLVPVSDDLVPADSWVMFVGDHKRASLMPVGGGQFYFFFDVPLRKGEADVRSGYREVLSAHFAGWPEPVQRLIARLDPERTNRVEIHDLDPLPSMASGRIALLGDAGHSTAPDLGQGGCQAMEDAWVLTNYLLTTNIGVEDALRRYSLDRCARTRDVVLKARQRADVTHGKDPDATRAWYAELATEDGERIMNAIAETISRGPLG